MIRTQIQVPEAQYRELREVARRKRRSMADCIREGILLFLRRSRATEGGLEEIAGKFRPRRVKDLKPHDRWFVESILPSKRSRRGR
jgi:hypothetical protein